MAGFDDDPPAAAHPGELGAQPAEAVGIGEAGDPVDGGAGQDPVAMVGGDHAQPGGETRGVPGRHAAEVDGASVPPRRFALGSAFKAVSLTEPLPPTTVTDGALSDGGRPS